MAVMTSIQQDQNKPTTEKAHSEGAMAMDVDVNGNTKQDDSSATQDSTTLSSSPNEKENVDAVNGNPKGVNAPPSPPIPTPPLHISVDGTQDLSDLHITSPATASLTEGAPNPTSTFHVDEEAASPGTKMDMDDDPISPLTSAPRSNSDSGANQTPEATKPQKPTVPTDYEMVDAPASSVKTGREREDDDEEPQGRPSKRAKTDELEDKPLVSQASTSTGPMPKVQAKYALQTIRAIRRTKDAGPFLVPVDPVKLAIPTYFDYVKNPMDLSTMEKKLQSEQYTTIEDFIKDFKLIISNCLIFNGPEHKVSEMARGIEATFERHLKNMPPPDQPEPPEKKSHKKGSSSKSGGSKAKPVAAPKAASPPAPILAPPPPAANPVAAPAPKSASAKSKSAKAPPKRDAKATQSQTFALDPSGMPTIRRESVQSDGRPKREIHPPPPRDLPYSDVKPRRKKTAAELKFCDQVMKELMKKQHEAYAYPFYTPVDPVALNIPDYFRIIKKPMDLSTISTKLKTNQYDNANEFEADIRLMLSNCYKFNPNGTAVNTMGKKLEEVFTKKWAEKTAFIQSQSGSRSPVSASPPPDEEGEMSGEEDPQVEILQKQLEMMQKQLESMKAKKKSPPAPAQGNKKGKAGSSTGGRKGSVSQPTTQRKKAGAKRSEEVPLLSMEEKTELSQRINLLSPSKMVFATKLIQENLPNLSGDDEIELDIDDLPPDILYKLHKYVTKHAPPAEQNTEYSYPPQPAHTAAPKQKAAPRPKKNKPMSATEQEAKIKDLNAKLAAFDNPSLARQTTNQSTSETMATQEEDESSSDDDDESSGSESEEE